MNKKIKYFFNDRNVLASLLLSLLILTPLAIIGYLGLIILLGLTLPISRRSLAFRLIISFLLFYSLNAVIGATLWIANVNILSYIPFFSGLTFTAYLAYCKPKITRPQLDMIGVFVALTIAIIPLMPLIKSPHFATLIQIFAYQGDNSSHLELVNADIKKQGYVYYSLEDIRPYAYQTLSGYPQAWHLNIAILQDQTSKIVLINNIAERQIAFFYGATVTLFSILGVLAYELILLISASAVSKKKKLLAERLVAGFITLALALGTFMTIFAYGFQTHITALLLTLAIVGLSVELWQKESQRDKKILFLLTVLLCASIALTWQVIVIPAALSLLYILINQKLVRIKTEWLKKNVFFVSMIIVLALAALFQFYILFHFGNDATTITQPGLSPEPSALYITLMFCGALLAGLYLTTTDKRNQTAAAALSLLLPAGAFAFLLYIVLLGLVGEPRYYFFKVSFTIILLATIIIGATLAFLVHGLAKKMSRRAYFAVCLIIIMAGVSGIFLSISKETALYYEGTLQGMDQPLAETLGLELKKEPDERAKIIAVGSCIPDQDYKATGIARLLSDDAAIKSHYFKSPFDKNIKPDDVILSFANVRPDKETLILSHDSAVLKRFEFNNSNLRLRGIDLDPYGLPKDPIRCPNFIDYKHPL